MVLAVDELIFGNVGFFKDISAIKEVSKACIRSEYLKYCRTSECTEFVSML